MKRMATRSEIQAFANRPWEMVSSLDRHYWAEKFRQNGSQSSVNASVALWRHMKSVRPEWPDAGERRRDLEHHVLLKGLLDKASRVLTRR